MTRYNATLALTIVALTGCTAAVSDLGGFTNSGDACDPRPTQTIGEDLDLQFFSMTPHVNQQIFAAIEVGTSRDIEAIFVIDRLADLSNPVEASRGLDSANLLLHIPEILPAEPATLAFWANSVNPEIVVFDPIASGAAAPDHQWTRSICPNGEMTFTHTTPFQSIVEARSTGAVWHFMIPSEIRRPELFDNFVMEAWAVRVQNEGARRQTRAYYRWAPFVSIAPGMPVPPQRPVPMEFKVGGNALGETRGAIDVGEIYEVNFVIDVDRDGVVSNADYSCVWRSQTTGPDPVDWVFVPDLAVCDAPMGFDPVTFTP